MAKCDEVRLSLGLHRGLGEPYHGRATLLESGLTHPNIFPLCDSGKADVFFFYVTPYIGGESLGERLVRE